EALRFIRERIFLIARNVPAFVMSEADPIDCGDQKENQNELDQNVQSDLKALNFFWFGCYLGHLSQPPFARLERLISQRQHQDGHAQVENNWPRIDDAARVRPHVLDRRKITERVPHSRADIEQNELDQPKKKEQRDRAKRNDRGDNLIFRYDRGE